MGVLVNIGRSKKPLLRASWWLAILLGLIFTVLPFVWILVSSPRPNHIIFRYTTPLSWRTFTPLPATWQPYIAIFQKGYGRALINTTFVALTTVLCGIVINSMAGFVFAKLEFPAKTFLFVLVILTFLVPFEATAIPLFILIRRIGWYDSYHALIVPGLANGIVVLMYRQFFLGIPTEFIESARVDGASWWRIYWDIFLPMSKPAHICAALIIFFFQWESFLWPLMAAPGEKYRVIQVAITYLSTEYGLLWNEQFAAAVVAASIPLVLIFRFQKYYVRGMSGTEIKG